MRKIFSSLFALCFIALNHGVAQESIIQNINSRESFTLNGKWHYIIDPYENGYYDYRYIPYDKSETPGVDAFFTNTKEKKGDATLVEYDFDKSPVLKVPGDWNSQIEKLFYYEGSAWYKKSFDYTKKSESNRLFLYFGAANYQADVYLNGKKLGMHKGGFTPFSFEITDVVKEKDNFVIVKVDNTRKQDEIPTVNTDWWNYGGLTRDVKIVELPEVFIKDYFIQLKKGTTNNIYGYIKLEGNGEPLVKEKIELSIPELNIKQTLGPDPYGNCLVNLTAKGIKLWSPETPKLYKVIISVKGETVEDLIGFRTIETKGADILLNGKSIFLRGICIHEENPMRGGRAYSEEDARMLLGWAKELNCNYVRLAHYPHNEHMARMADEMGLLVWEENPVYWTISWNNPYTYETAKKQLTELITRDKNRASIIIWSMANETPTSDERLEFLKKLSQTARNIDETRLISAALEIHPIDGNPHVRTIDDAFAEYVDVLSFNEYVGWYDGSPELCKKIEWDITQNKPVIISEFGAGALQGLHGDKNERWNEEHQEYLYTENIKMIRKIPQLRGVTPWILADFRSPRRMKPVIQDGWNRKGLISETGNKKKAFYILKSFYDEMEEKYK